MLCDKKHSHVQWRDFKMNVLVCDDDQQIVDSIIEELKKKSEETHVALRFYGFSQPSQIDLSLPYDIALLDIDMGETNGIELARKLRAENENIVIIFITNFIQYTQCIGIHRIHGIAQKVIDECPILILDIPMYFATVLLFW